MADQIPDPDYNKLLVNPTLRNYVESDEEFRVAVEAGIASAATGPNRDLGIVVAEIEGEPTAAPNQLSPEAERDFSEILEWISARSGPESADNARRRITAALLRMDIAGHTTRKGRVANTGERAIPLLPYLAILQLHLNPVLCSPPDRVVVLRILHGARQRPGYVL